MVTFAGYLKFLPKNIVYCDVNSFQTNILLDANLHVQIAGFGLARISEDPHNPTGAAHFSAPELFLEDVRQTAQKTYASDVYAFGCLYYEVSGYNMPVLSLSKESHRFITIPYLLWRSVMFKSCGSSVGGNTHPGCISHV